MRTEMNAIETVIKRGNLWGKRMRYAAHPTTGEVFYYGKDVSKALRGMTLLTHKLEVGTVCYFKGPDVNGKQINASRFLNTEAILEIVGAASPEYVAKRLEGYLFYEVMIADVCRPSTWASLQ